MEVILDINNLNYQEFANINISFDNGKYYAIVGNNNSGKTTLFRLISGLIPTENVIECNNVWLNNHNRFQYIKNLGIVLKVNKDSFINKTVYEEMLYPLNNLGYNDNIIKRRINGVLEYFNKKDIINKKIEDLSYKDKQLLLLMIAFLHQPRVILLDGIMEVFSQKEQQILINYLKKLVKSVNITVINFTSSLKEVIDADEIILISNKQIIDKFNPSKMYTDDKYFYENNLEIPFMVDLSVKLGMYNIINKEYINMKEMVDSIWP